MNMAKLKEKSQPKIKALKAKDKDFIRTLSHAGRMTREQAGEIDVNKTRLLSFKHDGYIDRTYSFDKSQKTFVESFYLTEKGRLFATDNLNVHTFYRSNGVSHDIALAGQYQKLSLEEQRSWKTENELRDMFKDKLNELRDQGQELRAMDLENKLQQGLLSPGDGGYISDSGSLVVIEIVTKHYGADEIQAKEGFAQVLGAEINLVRT